VRDGPCSLCIGAPQVSFLAELQRRNVIRMAGLYLVGAWLVTQVVGTILPIFGAPEWVARTVIVLLAIGFVPALVFSWVFELTPEGLRRDGEVTGAASIAPQTARRMDRTIIVVLLLALGYFAVDKFVLGPAQVGDARRAQAPAAQTASSASMPVDADMTGSAPAAVSPKSIAVLAFASLSSDEDSEYFADGIAEEILNALAKVKDLKVAGRTSSFYFKGRNESLQAIGSTLGVAHVLDGSVRRQGDRVRISAQLIQVDDGFNRWSETFDGDLGDVFALQDRIARAISDELKLVLDAGQQARLVDAGTSDPQAYALFLHASGVFNRRDSGEFRNAIALLEEAIQIDPSFARAHSRLAALHAVSSEYLGSDFEASQEAARQHARRALELSPDFAEPHAVIGLTLTQQRQFVEGRRELERALELDGSDASSNLWMGVVLVNAGYFRLGAAQLDALLAIDPLLPNALHHRGRLMEWAGDLEGARRLLERSRAVGGRNSELPLGFVSLRQGRRAEALEQFTHGFQFFSPGWPEDTGSVLAQGFLGDSGAREVALARLREFVMGQPKVVPGTVPLALVLLGEPEKALRVVASSKGTSSVWYQAVWSPLGKPARTSEAFPDFAREIGLAELWDQYGPPDLCRKDDSGDYRCE